MAEMVNIPKEAAVLLVAGAVNELWSQWANDDPPGCCPRCCPPCHGLLLLDATGQLDNLYGAYVARAGGADEAWDPVHQRIDRAWLTQVWSVDRGCPDRQQPRELHDRTAVTEEDL
jgi:hypothetical protein